MTTKLTNSIEVAMARSAELINAGSLVHLIPPITDPLGRSWRQPRRADIEIDGEHALMSRSTFNALAEYSASRPTGVYVGKMWKRHDGVYDMEFRARGGKPEWLLCWFGPCLEPECPNCDKYCSNHNRKILLVDGTLPE